MIKQTSMLLLLLSFYFQVIFASPLQLTQAEKSWIKQHPVIHVSNELDWAPYDFVEDGQPRGYSIDIIKHIAAMSGLKVKFVNGYSWAQLLQKFDNHEIDLIHVMSMTEQRAKKYLLSKSYLPWNISYIVRTPEKGKITEANHFEGKRVGIVRGWSTNNVLKQEYPHALFVEYNSSLEMLKALSASQIDIAIDNLLTVNYLKSKYLIPNIVHGNYLQLHSDTWRSLHFATHKETPELLSIFEKGFRNITTQEKMHLQQKWFGSTQNTPTSPSIKLTKDEHDYLQKKRTITLCIDPNWMPLEKFDANGKYVGISADFFKIFQKRLGISMEPLPTQTWSESIAAAKARECDLFSLAMPTPSRLEYMNFTTPYINLPLVLVTQIDVAFISDISYLNGKKIGIIKDYAFNELIRQNYPEVDVVDVENISEGLEKVANGELFGFVDSTISMAYIFENKYRGVLKISGKFDEKWSLGIGVRNDDPMLYQIFQKVVHSVTPEEKREIMAKHIVVNYEKSLDTELLIKIIAVALLILSFFYYHNRKLSSLNKKLQKLQIELKDQAQKDSMTNLYNRRYFKSISEDMFHYAKRHKEPLSLLMLDIDFFKSVNDTYGHHIGDEVIKHIARMMLKNLRKSDIVARFGGEEFISLLPNTDTQGAFVIAEKLRTQIAGEKFSIEGHLISIHVSIGIATIEDTDTTIDEIIQRSDKALYRAKESGRNKTEKF